MQSTVVEKKKKKFLVQSHQENCKACGLCYSYCPMKVLEPDFQGRTVVARPEDCIGCKKCVWICPDFAMWVEEVTGNTTSEKKDGESGGE